MCQRLRRSSTCVIYNSSPHGCRHNPVWAFRHSFTLCCMWWLLLTIGNRNKRLGCISHTMYKNLLDAFTVLLLFILTSATQLDLDENQETNILIVLAPRMHFSSHTCGCARPVSERCHAPDCTVTTNTSLCWWVSSGTSAQGSGKSRWHVRGSDNPNKLSVQTRSTYHSHFDVTTSGRAQEEDGDKLLNRPLC